ncbi:DUF6169 family protein [Spirosoma endophyticum]|uniref:Uncharacterized protein n=1 Tax=Spirosoma endophyticum TaxID=662367 RepID=A0A1I1RD77_9BACT|nr:DUF6169 family protein [Spirosoma endophyticum]SFD32249.1 hypothetical protein SAMN05216167_104348 [Spirosoma endophyticum]
MQSVPKRGYEYIFLGGENNTYAFITDQQVIYELKFKPSSYIFGNQPPFTEFAFEFVIEVAENPLPKLPPPDAVIPITLVSIFNDFFSLKETVVVYICENADGHAKARNRKFTQWFEQAKIGRLSFVKFDYHFGTATEFFYTSLIMRIDNPRMADVITSFQKLSVDYKNPEK